MTFKADNPGCDCCGPCCNSKSAAATMTGATISASGSDLLYALTASWTWDKTKCLSQSTASECASPFTDIRMQGPATSCGFLDPNGAGIWRTYASSQSFAFDTTCYDGGPVWTAGTTIATGAFVQVSCQVSCDGSGNASWVFIANMLYTIREGVIGCTPDYRIPDESAMTGMGYTVTNRDVGGNAIEYEIATIGAGGYLRREIFKRNSVRDSTFPYSTWDVIEIQRWTKSTDAALIGLSGTLNPTYNPDAITAAWSIS